MITTTQAAAVLDGSVVASLDHVKRLRDRIRVLEAAAVEAEGQVAHRIGVNLRAAGNPERLTVAAYEAFKAATGARPGFSKVWDAEVDTSSTLARALVARQPPRDVLDAASWEGPWPRWGAHCPGRDVHVVYVLFDAENRPCYVGSSSNLSSRLRTHRADGKRFAYWQAFRHSSRDEARAAETRMLREVMPYLNRKPFA